MYVFVVRCHLELAAARPYTATLSFPRLGLGPLEAEEEPFTHMS